MLGSPSRSGFWIPSVLSKELVKAGTHGSQVLVKVIKETGFGESLGQVEVGKESTLPREGGHCAGEKIVAWTSHF